MPEREFSTPQGQRKRREAPKPNGAGHPAEIPERLKAAYGEPDNWPAPDARLLNKGARPAPELPLECFRSLGGWIADMAASKSAPADYTAAALLATAAATIGAARTIQLRRNWIQPAILWLALIGPPGLAKTPSIKPFKCAARAIQRDEQGDAGPARRHHETKRQEAKERRSKWEDAVKTAVKKGQMRPQMTEAEEVPDEWVEPRLVASDATTEALSDLLAGNQRGLLLHRDELSGWLGNFGKYGGDGDAAFYLSAYDGNLEPVDRVKRTTKRGEHGVLSILGGIQPDKLQEQLLARTNDGLVARFLPVWPDPVELEWDVPDADEERAETILRKLRTLELPHDKGRAVPRVLHLTPDAAETFGEWYEAQGKRAQEESGFLGEFLLKSLGAVGRFALNLELLEWAATDGPKGGPRYVSRETVVLAIKLHTDYFEPMARRTYGDAAVHREERTAIALLAEIRKRNADHFNAVEAGRGWHVAGLSGRTKPEQRRQICDVLVDGGCIRKRATKGSKADDYDVNPRVLADPRRS